MSMVDTYKPFPCDGALDCSNATIVEYEGLFYCADHAEQGEADYQDFLSMPSR